MANISVIMAKVFDHRRFNLIAFVAIAVMVLIAYSNTFTASFHFDDNPAIIENPNIRHVTWQNIVNLLSTQRPMVDLSIMLNYQLSGLNVIGWHAFNISNHIVNSYLVYLLAFWTLTLPLLARQYGEKARRMAFFCALLFAVHPIQTESVTYIISRSETVTTFFYLATILLFVQSVRTGRFLYSIAALISSLCAMQSKEWAVTLPAIVLLYDYVFLSEGKIRPVLSRWFSYALIALPWVLVLYKLRGALFGGGAGQSYGFGVTTATGITPVTYLMTSLNVLWTYVRLLILPINQNLDYDYRIAKTIFEFPTFLSLLGHVAVVVTAVWLYIKKGVRIFAFGAAWFYITLSPVQSFVPIVDVIFEHRMYLPSIGLFLAFVAGYEGVFDWVAKRRLHRLSSSAG